MKKRTLINKFLVKIANEILLTTVACINKLKSSNDCAIEKCFKASTTVDVLTVSQIDEFQIGLNGSF